MLILAHSPCATQFGLIWEGAKKKKNHHIVAPKKDNLLNYSLSFGIKTCIPKIFN